MEKNKRASGSAWVKEYVLFEGENVPGVLHVGMVWFKYAYTSAGTSQRRFWVDWEVIWRSFILPLLGFLPPKCVARVYFVESTMVKKGSQTE